MDQKSVKLLLAITKSNWGGAQKYVYDLATHFQNDKRFDVTVLTGGDGDLVKKLSEKGISILQIPFLKRDINVGSDIRSAFWLYRTIRKEKPDILHLNSSKIGLLGAILGRISGVKNIVFTAHGWPFNETRPFYQRIIFRILAMLTVFLAHKTIAVSQSVINSLRAPRYLSRKMSCIYTGITPPSLYEDGIFFTEFGLEKTPGVQIVSIGELHISKGYDRALVALAHCKHLPWTYHIMGTGDKRIYLEQLIEQLGLTGRVHLHGFVENASSYLNSFDFFLFPSKTEALGYVAIEALFSKLPIIASNAGGIPEVLFDDPFTKIVDCNNEKKFREALIATLQKLPRVDESKRPGRIRFVQNFMFSSTVKVYLHKVSL